MNFTFNGTAIYVYGAKRSNHGYYSSEQSVIYSYRLALTSHKAQLDGGNVATVYGGSNPPTYQDVIFSAGGLDPNSEHYIASFSASHIILLLIHGSGHNKFA